MTTAWSTFLEQQNATRNDAGEWLFDNSDELRPELTPELSSEQNFICYLQSQTLLACEGPDSAKFLQGQLTCDTRELQVPHTALGAHCTPKGRMVSSFRIAGLDNETFFMRMDRSIIEQTRQSLGKYIVFSKAELYDRSEQWLALGLAGKNCKKALSAIFDTLPTEQHASVQQEGKCLLIQVDNEGQRYELWCKTEEASKLWRELSQTLPPVAEKAWQLQNIQQGLGFVESETLEMFIPQMLNYQTVGAISFKKGCYTGQEIVARMQYLGKLKRHMYRLHCHSDTLPLAGTALFSAEGEQVIGNIVHSAALTPNEYQMLAVVSEQAIAKNQLRLGSQTGVNLDVLSLPYAITKEENNL